MFPTLSCRQLTVIPSYNTLTKHQDVAGINAMVHSHYTTDNGSELDLLHELPPDDAHQMYLPLQSVAQRNARVGGSFNGGPLRFIDFFAGAGLVRLGLEPEWTCVWANDIDPRKQDVYERWFGHGEFALGDIADVRIDALPTGVDMAWASFPCQDLSLAGRRQGMSAERSGTFWEFRRLMDNLARRGERPPIVVIENVVGLLYGEDFSAVCEALVDLGMQFGPLVMDARRFLPQSRPRVFIVAIDAQVDCSPFAHEENRDAYPWFTKAVKKAYDQMAPPVRDYWRWWTLPEPLMEVRPVEDLMEASPTGVEWHEPDETERLLDMMTELNLQKTRLAMDTGPSVGFVYKRVRSGVQRAEVRFDGVAGCLRTPEGGSSRQIVLALDDGQARSRLLSPREAARLMGVPDHCWLPPKYNDAYRAMGDGVAVPVARWLSERLLVPLAIHCRDSLASVDSNNVQGAVGQATSYR